LASAQIKPHRTLEHQLEYGVNYVIFLNQNSNFNGWGGIYMNGLFLKHNYCIGYKTIFNKKHIIKLNKTIFIALMNGTPNSPTYLSGLAYNSFNLGYAYILPINSINDLTLSLGTNLSYRYEGSELVVFAHTQNTYLFEPLFAYLEYNSIGISPNAEIEYFFTKHIGLGVNLNLNYYPFEHDKLKGDGVDEPDPFYVQTYKPQNLNFTSTFKLAYKFSFKKH